MDTCLRETGNAFDPLSIVKDSDIIMQPLAQKNLGGLFVVFAKSWLNQVHSNRG